jgi:hypothetical protein
MENSSKSVTIASFVYNDKIRSFKNYIYNKFGISEDKIFQYSYDEDSKKILTFIVYLKEYERVDLKSFYPPTIIVHKKGECFYTINALNLLIEKISDGGTGNINYKDFKIDWDKYQNKIILVKHKELKIMTIKRDFS